MKRWREVFQSTEERTESEWEMTERCWENSLLGKLDDLPFPVHLLSFFSCRWVSYVPVNGAKHDLLHQYKTVVKISLHALLIKCNVSSLLICSVLVVSLDWDTVLREASKQLAPTKQAGKCTIYVQTAVTQPGAQQAREKNFHCLITSYSPSFNFYLSSPFSLVIPLAEQRGELLVAPAASPHLQ